MRHVAKNARLGEEVSKRQALHQRITVCWHDFLHRLSDGEIDSVFVLCGATAGNLGAILRSCTLLGVSAVCILGGPSRASLDKAFRFSMIEQKSHWQVLVVPVPSHVNAACAMRELKRAGVRLVGLVAKDGTDHPTSDLWDVDLARDRLGFVFGSDNEDGQAFAEGVECSLDTLASVPLQQFLPLQPIELSSLEPFCADTLNLSVTASIVAYERRRQLRTWWAKLRAWTRKRWSPGKEHGRRELSPQENFLYQPVAVVVMCDINAAPYTSCAQKTVVHFHEQVAKFIVPLQQHRERTLGPQGPQGP